jgi:long-chain fatty acid transport protein
LRLPGRRLGLLALAALAAAAAPPALASNGASPISLSDRAAGRGGADAAVSDDALSQQLNPAGMLRLSGWRFDISNMFTVARDRFVNDLNDSFDTDAGYLAPGLGFTVDPGDGSDFRVGFALEAPSGSSGGKVVRTSIYPDGEKENVDYFIVRAGPAFAWRPTPDLRLGAAIYYNYLSFSDESAATSSGGSSNGTVEIFHRSDGTPVNPPTPVLVQGKPVTFGELFSLTSSPDSNSSALFKLSTSSASAVSGTLGLQWDPVTSLTIGLAYTTPTYFTPLEGSARIDATQAVAAIASNPNIAAITGALFESFLPDGRNATFLANYHYKITGFSIPQQLSLGAALWLFDNTLLLAADFRWMNWSAAFSTFNAKLSGGTNPDINAINGSDRINSKVALNWNDVYIVAVGASYSATDWLVLRAGYNFASSPIKQNRAGPGSPVSEHHLAGGFTVFPWDGFGVTLSLVYALPTQQTNGVDPANSTYSFSSINIDQLFIYLGASLDIN